MNPVLTFILYLLALICFAAAAFGAEGRVCVNLVALGLALVSLVWVVQAASVAF